MTSIVVCRILASKEPAYSFNGDEIYAKIKYKQHKMGLEIPRSLHHKDRRVRGPSNPITCI